MGADPAILAPAQVAAHRHTLAAYERRRAQDPGTGPRGAWHTLDAGIAHEEGLGPLLGRPGSALLLS